MSGDEAGRRFEAWRDSELQKDLRQAEARGPESWRHTAAACYLIFCAPLVIILPLLRAAEVSRTWEVVLWFAAASAGVGATLVYRGSKASAERAGAIRGELKRRRGPRASLEQPAPVACHANPGEPRKRYRVFAYDVSEEPAGEPPSLVAGEFDDAGEALACARSVVDRELANVAPGCKTAGELVEQFGSFGEGAVINGNPAVSFNPYTYAAERAQHWIDQTRPDSINLPDAEKPKP